MFSNVKHIILCFGAIYWIDKPDNISFYEEEKNYILNMVNITGDKHKGNIKNVINQPSDVETYEDFLSYYFNEYLPYNLFGKNDYITEIGFDCIHYVEWRDRRFVMNTLADFSVKPFQFAGKIKKKSLTKKKKKKSSVKKH